MQAIPLYYTSLFLLKHSFEYGCVCFDKEERNKGTETRITPKRIRWLSRPPILQGIPRGDTEHRLQDSG